MIHGRVGEANLEKQTVLIELADGSRTTEHYDIFIIATGSTNGFWRHDRLEQLNEVEAELDAIAKQIKGAKRFAIIGGGPTGVSVADNVARSGTTDVHLFYSGDLLLPGYHPKASRWISHVLTNDGVTLHPHHRAVVPEHFNGEKLTTDPVEWSTEQPPFHADLTLVASIVQLWSPTHMPSTRASELLASHSGSIAKPVAQSPRGNPYEANDIELTMPLLLHDKNAVPPSVTYAHVS